jgi:hypothetical protein
MKPNELLRFNQEQLTNNGVKSYPQAAHKIVRTVGDLQNATLWDGTKVTRQKHLYVEGYGLVECANTELHFVYETPRRMSGWGLYCTCGSIAGVVGATAYSKLASPTFNGKLLCCIRLLTTKQNTGIGEHADGSHE